MQRKYKSYFIFSGSVCLQNFGAQFWIMFFMLVKNEYQGHSYWYNITLNISQKPWRLGHQLMVLEGGAEL